jgi:DNA ligase-associated metallophosphoesterase
MYSFKCNNQHLVLHTGRVIFWEEEATLILSDLHLGKTGHFRKSGIAIPQNVYKEDLQRLVSLVQFFDPRQLIIVGDLFHSRENKELDLFKRWRNDLSSVKFHLVKGNHDILPDSWYDEAGITVDHEQMVLKTFSFRHDSCTDSTIADPSLYCFSGHVHPGISIKGLARQSLHFPCFYFTDSHCVLPAFSRFTGTYSVHPQKGEHVFAIVNNSIIKVE